MAQSKKSGGHDPQGPGERTGDEKAFVENWWRRKFSMPNLPTGDDVIMFAHALQLLKAFRGTGDAGWITGPTEKSFLEAWWLRKFPVNPPKWGSILSLADAEALLIEFRKSTEARRPKDVQQQLVTAEERSGSTAAEARKRQAKRKKASR